MKKLKHIISFCLLLFIYFIGMQRIAFTQNAPVTIIENVGNAIPLQQVNIPVKVTGFNNVGSISLSIDYNFSQLHYVSGTKNPLLEGGFNIGDNDIGGGYHRLIIGWYGMGTTLPDQSVILDFVFTFYSGPAYLQLFDDGPSCMYSDNMGNIVNDSPTSYYYQDGVVCEALSSTGLIQGPGNVCQGSDSVYYNIAPVPNATEYLWTVPPGAVILGNTNSSGIMVRYLSNATSGNISVSANNGCSISGNSSLYIAVDAVPVANAGNDTLIPYGTSVTLHAANGGSGTYNYHWSPENLFLDPNIQNPQTIQLNASVNLTLAVTNLLAQCSNSDQVLISVADSTLTGIVNTEDINFQIVPNPADDHFFLISSQPVTETIHIDIFSSEGKLVQHSEVQAGNFQNGYRVDMKNIPAGFYFIKIKMDNVYLIKKLVRY